MRSLLSLIAVLAAAAPAVAQETSESIGPGMVYFKGAGYYVVEIDLDSISTEVRVTQPHAADTDDQTTVASHALEEGATVAINANYFGGSLDHPCGLARGFGQNYTDAYAEAGNCETSIGWTPGFGMGALAQVVDTLGHETDASFLPKITEFVTAGNYLLKDGAPKCPPPGGAPCDWGPKLEVGRDCSAVGVSADRKRFIIVATDTGTTANPSVCSGYFLQSTFQAHHASDAIFLDGGGSTKLWIRGKGYVTNETEDRTPPVVVFARPNGVCPSDCGGAACVQVDKPARAQCVGQACRGGLDATWNCDVARKARARCGTDGRVELQICVTACQIVDGQDDICVGGVVPPSDLGVAPSDMAVVADLGVAPEDADLAVAASDLAKAPAPKAGCSLASGTGDAGSTGAALMLLMVVLALRRRRAR